MSVSTLDACRVMTMAASVGRTLRADLWKMMTPVSCSRSICNEPVPGDLFAYCYTNLNVGLEKGTRTSSTSSL